MAHPYFPQPQFGMTFLTEIQTDTTNAALFLQPSKGIPRLHAVMCTRRTENSASSFNRGEYVDANTFPAMLRGMARVHKLS